MQHCLYTTPPQTVFESMKYFTFALAIVLVVVGFACQRVPARADERPNIILLLVDDLGYGDLSSFGSPAVQTPNLDRIGEQGMRFTHFYAASAVCSPTRASAMDRPAAKHVSAPKVVAHDPSRTR
ncbi:sulfatase-like hydrolase/transferase, partial [Roseimaritima sediminicola]|uniref:sulfatase-like hydrolase/transferase n=1 Tax=Roseimaritima sediminicola TaxID=2662066 RepID=UPI001EEDBE64